MPQIAELAPAKINLDLRVTGRRPDGYHELDSLVTFAARGDRLTFAPERQLDAGAARALRRSARREPDNLVLRAARRLADHAGRPPRPDHAGQAPPGGRGSRRRLGRCRRDPARAVPALAARLHARRPAPARSRARRRRAGLSPGRPARMRGIGERLEPVELPALELLLVNPTTPSRPLRCSRRGPHRTGARTDRPAAPRPRGPAGVAARRAPIIWRRRRAASRRRSGR